ncbi:MAG: alanine--tRNA ligase [Oscillospiraceae bacterium]|nr:alanine--tRNA ligase [Oscillospiraceae bacterium]
MKWTGLNDLREKFLAFFEGKDHVRLKSFPLIPKNDKSLLLINSGMAPLKPYFSGQSSPPGKRATSCQKCIRTPDIDRVGIFARYGTFFEMLGNFSFGGYFKREAAAWAWEFSTVVLELPKDKLWISVYLDDDEAFDIWTKEVGVKPERVVRLGKADNFWELGPGPCGPCSELYYDRGEQNGCGEPDCKVGCDCDRFVEYWNLVFTQFNVDGNGNYAPLDKPNIDTGMGLERLACIMQGTNSIFEVDTIKNVIDKAAEIANVKYGENNKTDISLRIITDHIRSSVFMVCDGVTPSNEGRGYVLRRLLRRAVRNGKILGINRAFMPEMADGVINESKDAYPELSQKRDYIISVIKAEEENFIRTLDKGMEILNSVIQELGKTGAKEIPGEQAFKLYDTYGFPLDLIKEIIAEHDITVDEKGFTNHMHKQREQARKAREQAGGVSWEETGSAFTGIAPTEFVGYTQSSCGATLLAISKDGENTDNITQGEEAIFVFDKTPLYAESGGQETDKGCFDSQNTYIEFYKINPTTGGHYAHFGIVKQGSAAAGTKGELTIDTPRRKATARNHTAAHLLQKALRDVLGDHVHQAGQLVDDRRLRFDFHHMSAMTADELKQTADKVNNAILSGLPVKVFETSLDSARKMGAMALFSEKYEDNVRVVDIDGYSIELCGGTHVSNTSQIGLFAILRESSVSAGVRRIEAVTGAGVLELIYSMDVVINSVCANLKLKNKEELSARTTQIPAEIKQLEQRIENLNQKIAASHFDAMAANSIEINGFMVTSSIMDGADKASLRAMGDKLRDSFPNIIAVIGSVCEGKGSLLAVCGTKAVEMGAKAGKIVAEIAELTGGKGGGRPDSAMAGVGEPAKLEKSLEALNGIIEKI